MLFFSICNNGYQYTLLLNNKSWKTYINSIFIEGKRKTGKVRTVNQNDQHSIVHDNYNWRDTFIYLSLSYLLIDL